MLIFQIAFPPNAGTVLFVGSFSVQSRMFVVVEAGVTYKEIYWPGNNDKKRIAAILSHNGE